MRFNILPWLAVSLRPRLSLLFLLLLTLTFVTAADTTFAASPILVNSFTDDGLANDGICTLREAVIAANKGKRSGNKSGECRPERNAPNTILLQPGTYTLSRTDNGREDSGSTGDLDITSDLTIIGAGADQTIIDGNGITDRIFHILEEGNATLQGMAITNGNVPSDPGGAIYNGTILTLSDVQITDSVTLLEGGGLYNAAGATLTATNVTVTGNTATTAGNGVYLDGEATLTNVTISGNDFVNVGQTSLTNVTLAADLTTSTSAVLTAYNTLIAGACSGTITSAGYNLIAHSSGCTLTGDTTSNLLDVDPQLAPLADNGGTTLTHAVPATSPAVEAGDNTTCPATDQRGLTRPQGIVCDIGAYEAEDPPQSGSTLFVNTTADEDDGICSFAHCSLREALNLANSNPDTTTIEFNIETSGEAVIFPLTQLPTIIEPIVIDGTTQPITNYVVLDGSLAPADTVGLLITAGDSTVTGLHIINFGSHGLLITDGDNNTISGNTIANNGGDGIRIIDSTGNQISDNNIYDNGGLPIDLGGDGQTDNDTDDEDTGANFIQNYPVLLKAVPAETLTIGGFLNSLPHETFTVEFFATAACTTAGPATQSYLGSDTVTTNENGDVYFTTAGLAYSGLDQFVTATATDSAGNTSEYALCLPIGPDNTSWPRALDLGDTTLTAVQEHSLTRFGESRWYKFNVQPGSKLIITLTDLPANYDLTVYRDIAQAYVDIQTVEDLNILGAEFAPEAFSPEAFSPEAFSPEAFSPEAFSPEAFSPEAFSPEAFSPEAFAPEAFSPEAFSPEAFAPEAFSPEAFAPEAFAPEAFSPEAFAPEAFSPEAFAGAQTRSLLGVSAFPGTASEGLILNTWNNTGDFYIRVRGANGAFDPLDTFHLEVTQLTGQCDGVNPITTAHSLTPTAGNHETVILTDIERMSGTDAEKTALLTNLHTLAARPEVNGVIVDLSADAKVAAANAQADAYPACPYAKNLVAASIEELVDGYWDLNPLKYVVIVGDDAAIPFFRYPDGALLANENNFVPPVRDATASQASLRLGYMLGQDAYGSRTSIAFKNSEIPIPELAVGRLVESALEANNYLTAYLSTSSGAVQPQQSPLVTGYDFLTDAATAVQNELELGTGLSAETLITPADIAPADPLSWTADDLRQALLTGRNDVAFLAGHFSASGALAADYTTRLTAAEVMNASIDLNNVLIYSAGCHSGYNLVDADGVPFVTEDPDWAQAFAYKGATFIGGTGYQYGDTDFLEYGERLYLTLTTQLRTGTGPVAVGEALAAAKIEYLAETPQMRGIHEKTVIQSALFGLPMFSLDMNGQRLQPAAENSDITATTAATTDPGLTLGLQTADLNIIPQFTTQTVELTNVVDDTTVTATYLTGRDGVLTNPVEPAMPLEQFNVTLPDTALRGIGFRGGSFTDISGILPLTGAPTTEIRGVHAPFTVDYFYPVQLWRANYFDALPGGNDLTTLSVTPVQFISEYPGSQTNLMRRYDELDLRLFYNDNIATYGTDSTPALSAAPAIVSVEATLNNSGDAVNFAVYVTGNPAAGIHSVWVTYSAQSGSFAGQWQSLDLTQSQDDSTLWVGTLPLSGTNPGDLRYIAQAVNGVGLVSMSSNLSAGYEVDLDDDTVEPEPTEIALQILSAPSGAYGTQAEMSAALTSSGQPLAGEVVTFNLGPQTRTGVTDANGVAAVTFTLIGLPGDYLAQATFAGTTAYAPASITQPFTITKQDTQLTLVQPAEGYFDDQDLLLATLTDVTGQPLGEKTVFFTISGLGQEVSRAVITDFAGRARLTNLPGLLPGSYSVTVYFNGTIPLGDVTLNLEDARYNPSMTSGSLTILNNPPDSTADSYTTAEDTTLTVSAAEGVLANDSDLNGQTLTAALVTAPGNGSLTLNSDGSFEYDPAANFNGTDTFTYVAHDGLTDGAETTVTISVTPVNDAPVAADDAYAVDENSSLTVAAPGVLGNDSDLEGDELTAAVLSAPTNGSLTLNSDGSFTYIPAADFYGADTFTYELSDGDLTDTATVFITVNMANNAPDCSQASGMVNNDPTIKTIWPLNKTFVPVNVVDLTDADGDALTVTITGIFQDEDVGKGKNAPDGDGVGTDTALVRAERDGNGDGRVYHIFFTADDSFGGQCSGELRIPTVPHDQGGEPDLIDEIDGGALYDSTQR